MRIQFKSLLTFDYIRQAESIVEAFKLMFLFHHSLLITFLFDQLDIAQRHGMLCLEELGFCSIMGSKTISDYVVEVNDGGQIILHICFF